MPLWTLGFICLFEWVFLFFIYIQEVELLGPMIVLFLVFLWKLHTVKDYIFKDLKDYICCDLMSSKRTSCPKSIMLLHHATLKLSFEAATSPILPILYSFNIASWSLAPPPSPNKNSSSRRPKAVSPLGWAVWADWQWVLRRNSVRWGWGAGLWLWEFGLE